MRVYVLIIDVLTASVFSGSLLCTGVHWIDCIVRGFLIFFLDIFFKYYNAVRGPTRQELSSLYFFFKPEYNTK